MAEALAGLGHNTGDILPGVSQADYFRLVERYEDADQGVADAVQVRKDLRAEIKTAGIPLRAFDRARRDADVSGEKRELEELAYRKMMGWRIKPVGYQAGFDLEEDRQVAALDEHELNRIEFDGVAAGKSGRRRDSNSWTPGTEAHQRWDAAWMRGQAGIAETLGGGGNGSAGAAKGAGGSASGRPASEPRPARRGRPPGSKNVKPRARRGRNGAGAELVG